MAPDKRDEPAMAETNKPDSSVFSIPTSPTDTRHGLARLQTISPPPQGHAESSPLRETLRHRPEAVSYGSTSFFTPRAAATAEPSTTAPLHGDSPAGHSSEQAQGVRSVKSPMLTASDRGLSINKGSKKPGVPRRTSSNVKAPHRGQEFSVDDAPAEVEDDQNQREGRQMSASGFTPTRYQSGTIRRRAQPPTLARVDSSREEEAQEGEATNASATPARPSSEQGSEDSNQASDHSDEEASADGDDDDDVSDAESFTLKDRQEAINETHPFGIRIWKPALYKKDRSVQKNAEGDIHSSPGGNVSNWLFIFNTLWTLCFGWWLALAAYMGAMVCFAFAVAPSAAEYGRVLYELAGYLFYPFGKFVHLEADEAYAQEDEGEGRSITEYEQWQSGDIEDGRLFFGPQLSRSIVGRSRRSLDSFASENDSLLGRSRTSHQPDTTRPVKRRLFGRGEWNTGRVLFFAFFYGLITPLLFIASGICWFLVFWIPMGKITMLLFDHLRRHPLALSFENNVDYSRGTHAPNSTIIVCTYRAVGIKYWKYTIDGTNIFFINLMGLVAFVIFDYFVLLEALDMHSAITHPGLVFVLALLAIIPLAYFIGQAVASISAQSSMGLGAAINAFFSTIVEVFLYCVALNQGKGQLVEGSIIGSIFAGILFLPGLSMCFGAIKRKTQRFNAKSAGVTSTMLLFAVIAAFGPTLFYQIYGTHELNCQNCVDTDEIGVPNRDCRRCYFSQRPALDDRFYIEAVRPYCWFAAVLLFLSYVIGLWFTLRTHAAVIWTIEVDEKKMQETQLLNSQITHEASIAGKLLHQNTGTHERPSELRETQLYKRILGNSLREVGLAPAREDSSRHVSGVAGEANGSTNTPHLVPPKSSGGDSMRSNQIPGFSEAQTSSLYPLVAEFAATAATYAARDAARALRKKSYADLNLPSSLHKPSTRASAAHHEHLDDPGAPDALAAGGHDAPNWSRLKSSIILCGATVLYALIAEILVNTVDEVLVNISIDEKFLGITLFALVPNTTEFLNAISFAMNGNIALSMEIGSAYALQVCLLQIPALVLYSAFNHQWIDGPAGDTHSFSLIFPQWDMVTVILCVFLLSYMYGEGKSNYFKGSILLLSYLVVIVGFWLSSYTEISQMGISRFDRLDATSSTVDVYRTVGRSASGMALAVA